MEKGKKVTLCNFSSLVLFITTVQKGLRHCSSLRTDGRKILGVIPLRRIIKTIESQIPKH